MKVLCNERVGLSLVLRNERGGLVGIRNDRGGLIFSRDTTEGVLGNLGAQSVKHSKNALFTRVQIKMRALPHVPKRANVLFSSFESDPQ